MAFVPTGISSNKGDTEVSTALRLTRYLGRRVGIVIADVEAITATLANANLILLVPGENRRCLGC